MAKTAKTVSLCAYYPHIECKDCKQRVPITWMELAKCGVSEYSIESWMHRESHSVYDDRAVWPKWTDNIPDWVYNIVCPIHIER